MSMFTLTDARQQFTLTDAAAAKVKGLIEAEDTPRPALRVAVRPGGCSGFSYEMFFDADLADDDMKNEQGGVTVVIDPRVAAPRRRRARLQGRPPGRRVPHHEPQRGAHLRLRPVVQLVSSPSQVSGPFLRCSTTSRRPETSWGSGEASASIRACDLVAAERAVEPSGTFPSPSIAKIHGSLGSHVSVGTSSLPVGSL